MRTPVLFTPPPKTTKRRPIRSILGLDAVCATLLGSVLALQRAQKVEQVLLLLLRQPVLEKLNHRVGFRPPARMLIDGVDQIGRPSIVQEEDALAESPKRRRAELIARGPALRDAVGKIAAHVVEEQVREEVDVRFVQARGEGGRTGLHRRRMAKRTADLSEDVLAVRDRLRTARLGR